MSTKPYPSDVSDEEWDFVVPYLALIDEQVPQRRHSLREVFNALRWLARAGAGWRMLPNDLQPWPVVYQQAQSWLEAGCFEAMVSDMRSIIRTAQGRQGQHSAGAKKGPRAMRGHWAQPRRVDNQNPHHGRCIGKPDRFSFNARTGT